MYTLCDEKKSYRKKSLIQIDLLSDAEKKYAALDLYEQFFKYIDIDQLQTLAVYAEDQTEIAIKKICQSILEKKKTLCFPKVTGKSMDFFTVQTLAELHKGQFGLLEPQGCQTRILDIDLMLVPGRAFDRHGVRIGRGAGFYDRYLQKHPVKQLFGIAYDFQMYEKLPYDQHDVRMQAILTDKALYKVKKIKER